MFSPKKDNTIDQLAALLKTQEEHMDRNNGNVHEAVSKLDLKMRVLYDDIEKQREMLIKGLMVIRDAEKKIEELKKNQKRLKYRKDQSLTAEQMAEIVESILDERATELEGKIISFSEAGGITNRNEIEDIIDEKIRNIKLDFDVYTTKTRILNNQTVDKSYKVIETSGKGNIEQILLTVQNSDFGLFLAIDGNVVYDKTYSYFSTNSDYLQNISALYESDTQRYYLSIRNFHFKKGFRIDINTISGAVFDEIMVKYTIRDEKPV